MTNNKAEDIMDKLVNSGNYNLKDHDKRINELENQIEKLSILEFAILLKALLNTAKRVENINNKDK